MKFILPEHNEALRQLNLAKQKIEQPILSLEQLELGGGFGEGLIFKKTPSFTLKLSVNEGGIFSW
ncbi:hypothetical protein [Bacillus pumilus]|uniref:hypothetical protein n=1 Tax=Bacillus pumilus TaxID=1408 RepID=UPI002ABE8FB6|nr:hypothetical protein [Bacillus pumilus]